MTNQGIIEKEINGTLYTISVHPGFPHGAAAALKVQTLIQPHVLKAQEKAASALNADDRIAIKEDPDKAEDIILEALGLPDMLAMKREMLEKVDVAELMVLAKDLFRYSICPNGNMSDDAVLSEHFRGSYKNFIPLMNEVIDFNGFLELDPGALMA